MSTAVEDDLDLELNDDFDPLAQDEELLDAIQANETVIPETVAQVIADLVEKIWVFVEVFCDVHHFPYQAEFGKRIIESVIINDGEEITGLFSRQSGKTETLANVIAALMVILPKLAPMFSHIKDKEGNGLLDKFRNGLWVGTFAPIEQQAETLFSRIVTRLTSEHAVEIMLDPEIDDSPVGGSKQIRLKRSGSLCRMHTANPRAKIESKSYHLLVIDEAQGADEYVTRKSIMPMGAFYNASKVLIGTPDVVKGHFYRTIQFNKRRETRKLRRNHFQFDWRHCAKYNPNYRKYVQGEALRIGEDSDEFRLSYKLEWLLERGMFITETSFDGLGDKCLLPGAELLTDQGWRRIEEIRLGDVVATMNPDTRTAEWRAVTGVTAMDYDGPVLEFTGDVRLTVTANHRVYGSTDKVPDLRWWAAKDVPAMIKLPQTADFLHPTRQLSDVVFPSYRGPDLRFTAMQWASFLGQWLADGSLVTSSGKNIAKITAVRPDKNERIRGLLTEVGARWWAEGTGRKDICIANKALVAALLPYRGAKNKSVPRQWLASLDTLTALWHGLFTYGDGHWRDPVQRSGTFRTVSPQLADDVAEMAVLLGYRPTTNQYINSAGNPTWCVSVLRKTLDTKPQRQQWGHYQGPVYCVTVPPHHTMLARQDGTVCWTGNSMEVVKAWWKSPVLVGIDTARKIDSTVVTVVWVDWDRPDEFGFFDHRVLNWLEIHGEDWETQYFQVVEFLANYDVLAIGIGEGGNGDAFASRMRVMMPRTEVIVLQDTRPAQSARWKHLNQLIQRESLSWPAHAKSRRLKVWRRFRQQMLDLEKNYQGPHMLAEAPDEAEAHDDYPDSLANACSLTEELIMPEVEVSENQMLERTHRAS